MNPPGLHPLPIDVLSVQSLVVYGSVGNNVALPALRSAGLFPAAVPTVFFSNTPHYPTIHGGPIPPEWFAGYLDDLDARDALTRLRAVVVGYLGSPAQALILARWLAARRRVQPDLLVVIDPVIGDHDSGIYVDPALVDAYRGELLPLATVLTPNSFEVAALTGEPTGDIESTVAAARRLLRGHTRWVVVTSAAPATWPDGRIRIAVVSDRDVDLIEHARVEATPKGTGDLFTALTAAGVLEGLDPGAAARRASARVVEALDLTREQQCAELLLPAALRRA